MKKFFKVLTIICCIAVVLLVSTGVIWASAVTANSHLDESLLPKTDASSTFYSENLEVISVDSDASIAADEIPKHLKNAVVALEDKRFYSHKGVDYVRTIGATVNNIKSGGFLEGGSTITQQLVKNTHLTQEKTLTRKLKEMKIAKELEKYYEKDEILAMYLNVVYFGNGIYGATAAAHSFFNKEPAELTVAECATLAAVLKNPAKYSPERNLTASTERRNLVLSLMQKQGFISEEECETATASPTVLDSGKIYDGNESYILSATAEAAEILNLSQKTVAANGFKIATYFDVATQSVLQNILKYESLSKPNANGAYPEGVAVVVDNKTMGINGCYSTVKRQIKGFNRPVGSTVKPFLYAAALNRNLLTAGTPIDDSFTDFPAMRPKTLMMNTSVGRTLEPPLKSQATSAR